MVICNVHDKIIKLATELERLDVKRYDTVEELFDEVESIAWGLRTEAETAKEMGIKMEDRLREYSSAIEDLGFKRVRE